MELIINDRIINRKVKFFNQFSVQMKYDSIASAFKFDFLFNPDNPEHKEMFVPGHFHICKLEHLGERVLTGYFIDQDFVDAPEQELTSINGYSLPGFLEDCEIYPSTEAAVERNITVTPGPNGQILGGGYPLQSDGLTLKEIATKLIAPFRLQMVVDKSVEAEMNAIYDQTTAKESQSIKSYLCELAAQRNIVITHDQFGRLVFTRPSSTQKPVFYFNRNDGYPEHTKMSLSFGGKSMHSHIKVIQQQDPEEGTAATENEIINPYVPFVFRPHVVNQSSGDANNRQEAANNSLANELRNFNLNIEIQDWKVGNKIIYPGSIISVLNPYVYLYKKTNWFVESVTLEGDSEKMTAKMHCVLPEVYNGQNPKYIYEGINLR